MRVYIDCGGGGGGVARMVGQDGERVERTAAFTRRWPRAQRKPTAPSQQYVWRIRTCIVFMVYNYE